MLQKNPNKRSTGSYYEETAAAFLQSQGYEILEKNYRDRRGEIDIIAKEGNYLIFIEVKYRKDESCGYPEEAVDERKQRKIRHVAARYLYQNNYNEETPCRFDVVSIVGNEISVIKDAF